MYTPFFKNLKADWIPDMPPRFIEEFLKVLRGRGTLDPELKPWDFYKREAFDRIWNQIPNDNFLQKVIGSEGPRIRVKDAHSSLNPDEMYRIWLGITNLFRYRGEESIKLSELLEKTHEGQIVILDLSKKESDSEEIIYWNEEIQFTVIQQFLDKITSQAEKRFNEGGGLNSLVVIDEAHRLAPRRRDAEDETTEKVRKLLIDAIRTTRKFGLGWMFISQTLSSLDRAIIDQIRIFVFGFGLAWGIERQALRELIGGQEEAFSLYQMFRDPQSTLGKKEYSFMTIGPISPLSFSGTPLFITALEYPEEFLRVNNLIGGNEK